MKLEELKKHKKILIIGYGIEGKAMEAFLKKHYPDAVIGIADKKNGDDYLDKQKDYNLAIKSPGVNPKLITIPYTTPTNIFFSNSLGKTIGVTGTKGKSTTATLIYEMLKKQGLNAYLAGNIGKPMISLLDKLNEQSWTVLELSSFQLQDTKYSPNIAVMLMVTSEHLDYHKDAREYVEAKRNILRFQTRDDFAVINRDYPASNESDILTEGKVFYVSREREGSEGCFVKDGKIILRTLGKLGESENQSIRQSESRTHWQSESSEFSGNKDLVEQEIIKIKDILLLGKHNLENVCAAAMAADLAGVSKENIASVLKNFSGLEHRLEFVGEKYGVSFYNDSLATIPEAVIEGIDAFGDKVETLIAGGYDRGLDYSELGKYLAKSSVRNLILFPPSGKRIWEEVMAAGGEEALNKYEVDSMKQAVLIASEETPSGKICLMSPGAASFGTFTNYKDRGEQFKAEIDKLGLA